MSTWYRKDLGDGVAAYGPSNVILDAFPLAYIAAGRLQDMAVFSRHDLHNDMVIVYFSPSAISLAERFGATPCPKPLLDGRLVLLAGNADSFAIHYPAPEPSE